MSVHWEGWEGEQLPVTRGVLVASPQAAMVLISVPVRLQHPCVSPKHNGLGSQNEGSQLKPMQSKGQSVLHDEGPQEKAGWAGLRCGVAAVSPHALGSWPNTLP